MTTPIRGNGRCPKPGSSIRYAIRKCNNFNCAGDEVCIAKQDLVFAIDPSGSLRESGFKFIKGFSAGLVDKYMGSYGYEDMRIGVVQFGNGEILDDGTVSDAWLIQKLTNDMAKVKTSIEGLEYKKGFTDMAQAFTVAERMFLLGGRRKAMSAVLTLTDGKPSFLFNTYVKVLQLKDKHVKLFFAPVTEFAGEELALILTRKGGDTQARFENAAGGSQIWIPPNNHESGAIPRAHLQCCDTNCWSRRPVYINSLDEEGIDDRRSLYTAESECSSLLDAEHMTLGVQHVWDIVRKIRAP